MPTTLVIVTDLDGTLLDAATYAWAPASETLERVRRLGVPLVFCSSKTRAEIEDLHARIGVAGPFIAENGGALYLPTDGLRGLAAQGPVVGGHVVVAFGPPYDEIVRAVRDAAAAEGVRVLGFADMSAEDVAEDCGLALRDAELAKRREFDEPFRIVDSEPEAVDRFVRALGRKGLRVVSGGRYHHATGAADKGTAVRALRALVGAPGDVVLAGLGDAPNDVAMLRAVDIPIVVAGPRGDTTARVRRDVPGAVVTDRLGPDGWADAVDALLDRLEAGEELRPELGGGRP